MSKKSPPRLCVNLALDTVDGITFLNTEAFTSYMSKHDPIEIKPESVDKVSQTYPF